MMKIIKLKLVDLEEAFVETFGEEVFFHP